MKITVTKTDIKKGRANSMRFCPLALAFRRHGFKVASVIGSFWRQSNMPGKDAALPLPKNVKAFIERFDKGKPVKPFTFELDYEP